MGIIQEILNLQDSEIDNFIDERLEYLKSTNPGDNTIDLAYEPIFSFINPDQKIIIDHGEYGYYLNDKNIYKDLINVVKENPNRIPLIHTFYTLYKYFGEPKPTAERDIVEYYNSKDEYLQKNLKEIGLFEQGSVTLDMEEFRNKEIAVCSQFAPAAHNLNCFLGVESYVLTGYQKFEDGKKGNSHSYNCARNFNDELYIIDFLIKSKNPDGTLKTFLAQRISQEDFNSFIEGDIDITVTCTTPKITYTTEFWKNIHKKNNK